MSRPQQRIKFDKSHRQHVNYPLSLNDPYSVTINCRIFKFQTCVDTVTFIFVCSTRNTSYHRLGTHICTHFYKNIFYFWEIRSNLVWIRKMIARFDGWNGKCTLVNARAVTDFVRDARVGKIMQMFRGTKVPPSRESRWWQKEFPATFSININTIHHLAMVVPNVLERNEILQKAF